MGGQTNQAFADVIFADYNILPNDTARVEGFTAGHDPTLRLRLDRTGEAVTLRDQDEEGTRTTQFPGLLLRKWSFWSAAR